MNSRFLAVILVLFSILIQPVFSESDEYYNRLDDSIRADIRNHNYANALATSNSWIAAGQQLGWGYWMRSEAYNAMGQYDKALVDINEALELDPKNGAAYGDRGSIYSNQGNYQKSLESWRQALSHLPKVRDHMGLVYMKMGQPEHLRLEGRRIEPEDVARLSPLQHKNFNFLGRYQFSLPDQVMRGEYRSSRSI